MFQILKSNPHPQTGLRSMHGRLMAFNSNQGRNTYIDEYRPDGFEFISKCNKFSARKFYQGCSMYIFNQILNETINEAQ